MRRIRAFAALALAAVLWLAGSAVPASGETDPGFSFAVDKPRASGEDMIKFTLRVGANTAAAGFRVRVAYDDSVLRFSGTEASSRIESGTLQTNGESNPIYSVYVCNPGKGYAPELLGTVLTFLFQVRADAPAGRTEIGACVDEVCDYSGAALDLDHASAVPLEVEREEPAEAFLTALEPSQGSLHPAFSPDVYFYGLDVGSDVRSVTFRADASEGASVKVSRKSLNPAGTDTAILITVTSADGSKQVRYSVTVSRAKVQPEGGETSSKSGKASTSKASGSAKARGTGSRAAEEILRAAKKGKASSSSGKRSDTLSAAPQGNNAAQDIPAAAENQNRPASAPGLTILQNRMPDYLIGVLAAGFCITVGIALSLWFSANSGKKK